MPFQDPIALYGICRYKQTFIFHATQQWIKVKLIWRSDFLNLSPASQHSIKYKERQSVFSRKVSRDVTKHSARALPLSPSRGPRDLVFFFLGNVTFLLAVFSEDAGSFVFPLADRRHM